MLQIFKVEEHGKTIRSMVTVVSEMEFPLLIGSMVCISTLQ